MAKPRAILTHRRNAANAVIEDSEWWADNQDDLNERFAAWLIQ